VSDLKKKMSMSRNAIRTRHNTEARYDMIQITQIGMVGTDKHIK
jgi:hypothetical protein